MEVLQNKIREKMLSHSKWRQLQQESNKSVSVLLSVVLHEMCLVILLMTFPCYSLLLFLYTNMACVVFFCIVGS
jgi:hypothetical protein